MGVGDLFDNVRLKLGDLIWSLREKRKASIEQAAENRDQGRIRTLTITGGVLVLIIIIVVTTVALTVRARQNQNSLSGLFPPEKIADEDYFLPAEPDLLPPIILFREPRERWTVEDAAPFWTDPSTFGEKVWEQKVEEYVDTIMESVP
jgi:hypothetical protein